MTDIQRQILSSRFAAIAREGAEIFARMARSPAVIDEGQYACAILDSSGRLVAQEQGEPSQLAAVQATVAWLIDAFAFDIAEGDMILTGDPYCGGTVCGALTLTLPVAHDGEIAYFVALRFTCPDLAGDVPGVFQPDAHEIWQEGLRVTPVKLVRANAPERDVRRYILKNTRAPEHLDGDLSTAEVAAHRVADRLQAMLASRGADPVREAADYRIAHARTRMAGHLASLADGAGEATAATIDATVRVTVRHDDDRLAIDFSGSSPSSETTANLTRAATAAVVLTQLAAEVIEDTGLSQGILDSIDLALPEASCINAAFPSAVSLGWRHIAPAVSSALARAVHREPAFTVPPPLVVLFPEIGASPTSLPLVVSPGFRPMANIAGGDAASGRRRLISAEQTELDGVLSLLSREFEGDGITAEVAIRQSGIEGVIVPGAGHEPDIVQDAPLSRDRSNVLAFQQGARIRFVYPERREERP